MFHKEGHKIILATLAFVVISVFVIDEFIGISWLQTILQVLLLVFLLLILQFFRNPKRHTILNNSHVLAPVDGKVVVIEEVFEISGFDWPQIRC